MRSSSPASPSPSPRLRSLSSSISLPRTYSKRGQKRRPHREPAVDDQANDVGASPDIAEHSPQPRGKRSRQSPSPLVLVTEQKAKAPGEDLGYSHLESTSKHLLAQQNSDEDVTEPLNLSGAPVAGPSTIPPLRPKSPTTPRASRFRFDSQPKNLASLFPSPSRSSLASSPFGSPSKLHSSGGRRQMLTKTQSLGQTLKSRSNGSSPASLPQRTRSMPDTPSKLVETDSPSRPNLFTNMVSSVIDADAGQQRSGGAKRTYGSKRTIRENRQPSVDLDEDDSGLNLEPRSYADLRKRYQVTNAPMESMNEEQNAAESQIAAPPQVVADMRSKGENRRFIDEIDYLLEGLSNPQTPLSTRRSSSMEILTQVQFGDWLARALVCGQIERMWESLWTARGEGDVIMDVICTIFIAILAASDLSFDAFVTAHAHELRASLLEVMKRATSEFQILVSKRVLSDKLSERILYLGMQSSTLELAPRQLACSLLVKIAPIAIDSPQNALSSPKVLSIIMSVLAESTTAIPHEEKRSNLTESPLAPAHLSIINNCLDVASSLITNDPSCLQYALTRASKWSVPLCQLVSYPTRNAPIRGTQSKDIENILEHVCHLLALLVTLSSEWALALLHEGTALKSLASRAILQSVSLEESAAENGDIDHTDDARTEASDMSGSHKQTEDILGVVLAVLVGVITHGSAGAPLQLAKIQVREPCGRQSKCKRKCTCRIQARCFGVRLAAAYSTQVATPSAVKDLHAIARGSMAILLTSFITSGLPESRDILLALPGPDKKTKVGGLRESMQGLSGFEELILKGLPSGDAVGQFRSVVDNDNEGHDDDEDNDTILGVYMSKLDNLDDTL